MSSISSRSGALTSMHSEVGDLIKRAATLVANTVQSPTNPSPDLDEASGNNVYTLKKALLEAGAETSDAKSRSLQTTLSEYLNETTGWLLFKNGRDHEDERKERYENLLATFQQVSKLYPQRPIPKQGMIMK